MAIETPLTNLALEPGGLAASFAPQQLRTFLVATRCGGDADGDGDSDVDDLLMLLGSYGDAGGAGDLNHDGVVDLDDLLEILANFGQPC